MLGVSPLWVLFLCLEGPLLLMSDVGVLSKQSEYLGRHIQVYSIHLIMSFFPGLSVFYRVALLLFANSS